MNDGPSKLWSIVFQACEGNAKTFLQKWHELKHLITLSDLREKPLSGEHAGKTILWLAAKAASTGKTKPLKKIWGEFGNKFTISDLRQSAQSGMDQNKSVLWLIAKSTFYNYLIQVGFPTRLSWEIWERFGNNFSITDLRVHPYMGPESNQTVIWLLSQSSFDTNFFFFKKFWERFKPNLKMSDLLIKDSESVIDFLLMAGLTPRSKAYVEVPCYWPHHQLLLEILRIFPGEIPEISKPAQELLDNWPKLSQLIQARNDFFATLKRARQRQDYCQETYIHLLDLANLAHSAGCLCAHAELKNAFKTRRFFDHLPFLLPFAAAASHGHPEPLLHLLSQFEDKITIDYIRKGNIMSLLVEAANKKIYDPLIKILDLLQNQFTTHDFNEGRVLSQLLNMPKAYINEKTVEILAQIPGMITDRSLLSDPRIRARNDFCSAIEQARHYSIKKLFELAEVANQQGYLRAFYELGEWLLENGYPNEAFEAYAKMPSIFKQYEETNARTAEECFAIAVGSKSLPLQNAYLRKSLAFALKCKEPERASLIEAIAEVYILKHGNFAILNHYPQLTTAKSINECFVIFDQIKEEIQQAHLTEKFKKLTIKTPSLIFSETQLPFSSSPVKDAHINLHKVVKK